MRRSLGSSVVSPPGLLRRRAASVLIVAGLFLAAGPEAVAVYQSKKLRYAAEAGVTVTPPPPDRARIVLIRPEKAWKRDLSPLYLDGEFLAALSGRTAYQQAVAPGAHELTVLGERLQTLSLSLEPGEILHVVVDPEMGKWSPWFRLLPIAGDAPELDGWLPRLYEVEPAEGTAAEYQERLAKRTAPEDGSGGKEEAAVELPSARRSAHLRYAPEPGIDLPPPGDRALIVFLRESGSWGSVECPIFSGDDLLTFLTGETAFLFPAEPGSHRFMILGENVDLLYAELEAGRTYFVLVTPQMGKWEPRFRMVPIVPDGAAWADLPGWLEKVTAVEPTVAAGQWAGENLEAIRARRDAYFPSWEALPDTERTSLRKSDGVEGSFPR